MTKSKKKSIFAPVVIIVFTLVFIAMAFVWEYLYRYLAAYEMAVPAHEADRIAKLYATDNFSDILEMQGVKVDKFNTYDEYTAFLHEVYGEDFTTAKAVKTGTSGEDVLYAICCGKTKVCDIVLSQDGTPDEFGFRRWKVSMEQVEYPKNHGVKICVPKGSATYLNGIRLSQSEMSSESHGIKGYGEVRDESLRPQFDVYEVNNLLNEPKVRVLDASGNEMKLTSENGKFYALPEVSAEMEDIAKKRAEEVAVKYALYSITDLKFADIQGYLYKDSDYYDKVRSFYNEWYREHTFSYDGVEFDDIIEYDSEHFSIRISFVYHINIGYKIVDYAVSYNMFFIKSGGEWLLCGMEL